MTIHTNLSFHGVARIAISEINNLALDGEAWQCMTLHLHDATGDSVYSFQIHAPPGQELRIHFEGEMDPEPNHRRIADRIDGYDRDDLGESPDY